MITREAALLVLDGLCKVPVRCRIHASSFSVWIEGRVSLAGDLLSLKSDGTLLEVRLSDEMVFEYAEPKDILEGEPTGEIVSGLGVSLPLRLPVPLPKVPPPRDKIIFLELSM